MSGSQYTPPSLDGYALEPSVRDAIGEVAAASMAEYERIWGALRRALERGQLVSGALVKGNEAGADEGRLRPGMIVGYRGTWASAHKIPGMAVCTGARGTPALHDPARKAGVMLRAVQFGKNAPQSAGSASYNGSGYSGETGAPSGGASTEDVVGGGYSTVSGDMSCHTHDISVPLPQSVELIWLMKV